MIVYTVTQFHNPAYGLRSPDNRWHYDGVSCVDTLSDAKGQIGHEKVSKLGTTRKKINGEWKTTIENNTERYIIESHTI